MDGEGCIGEKKSCADLLDLFEDENDSESVSSLTFCLLMV